ncbi:MAG: hypothetical protein K0U47_07615 [Epsilonproteobacteria bacterium]|nr:hypothetical protein [Campylobacterota bacterium]
MQHTYTSKEKDYLESFHTRTLDLSQFHHREHLQITYTLLIDKSIEESYQAIKEGILNILHDVGVDTTKYHESMTYGWVKIVKYFMIKTPPCESFDAFIVQNEQLLDMDILYQYYSKTLIQREEARLKILPPDLKEIDL